MLPSWEIPSLVDEEGNFSNNPSAAGLKYYFSKQARLELVKELAAQFEKFKSTGLPLSQIDAHLHMHVHPVIFNAALKLRGERYGVRRMRVPEDELRQALRFDGNQLFKKAAYGLLFLLLARYRKRKLKERKFVFAERVYGNLQSGRMREECFLNTLDHLRAETNEIYFHPAVYETNQWLSGEQRQFLAEFEALTSPKVRERLGNFHIKLINYFGLEPSR